MEALEEAFKINSKDLKRAVSSVQSFDEDEDEAGVGKFLVWCAGDKDLQRAFMANAKAWDTYKNVAKVMSAGAKLTEAMKKRGDESILDSADYEIRRAKGGSPEAPTGPTKQERAEANRGRREEEERQRQLKEAEAIEEERRKKVVQDQQARATNIAKYAHISMTNAIAKAAWDQGVGEYVRSRTGDITLGLSGSRDEIETALAHWASWANTVSSVQGVFKCISKFKKPQDKAAKGGAQVGDTLDTREWQGNFILFLGKYGKRPWVNVHVDMTGQ